MVVHRRPAEVQPDEAVTVYAVDLLRLRRLIDISEKELIEKMYESDFASRMQGIIVNEGEDVTFEAVGLVQPEEPVLQPTAQYLDGSSRNRRFRRSKGNSRDFNLQSKRKKVTQVLLTAAARPSALDIDTALPKCLTKLGSQTVISHILRQLYAAGITRVVISVAAGGDKIMAAVKATSFYTKMTIEFLDLGLDNDDGHARSILAARHLFQDRKPFLIHMADHIFDKAIISRLMEFDITDFVACALVETEFTGLLGLPTTAVKVRLGAEHVTKISRDLTQYNGIEAGLFLSSTAIFQALQDLAGKKSYFSLADAMSYFTQFNKLTYMETAGRTWLSIETQEQLHYTQDNEEIAMLSPWTVFLASVPSSDQNEATVNNNEVHVNRHAIVGVSGNEQQAKLRVVSHQETEYQGNHFEGFVVGVTNKDRFDIEIDHLENLASNESSNASGDQDSEEDQDEQASAKSTRGEQSTSQSSLFGSKLQRANSFLHTGTFYVPFVFSFPAPSGFSMKVAHRAYLIEMNPEKSSPVSGGSQYMLAFPNYPPVSSETSAIRQPSKLSSVFPKASPSLTRDNAVLTTNISGCNFLLRLLPSNISQILIETTGNDAYLRASVVVIRQVPIVGFFILCISVVMASFGERLWNVQNGSVTYPLLVIFWRSFMLTIALLPFAIFRVYRNGVPNINLQLIMAGFSFAVYATCFTISLTYTTYSNALLYSNVHGLMLVCYKSSCGQSIPIFEGLGAILSVVGVAITSLAHSTHLQTHAGTSPLGDGIALFGAVGGAAYFWHAKALRSTTDLTILLITISSITMCSIFIGLVVSNYQSQFWTTDFTNGIFGWLSMHNYRLLVLLAALLIGDAVGTFGYLVILKYFDPIVISTATICQLLITNIVNINYHHITMVMTTHDLLSILGGLFILGGCICVVSTQRFKIQSYDITKAILNPKSPSNNGILYSRPSSNKSMNKLTSIDPNKNLNSANQALPSYGSIS